MPFGSAEAPSIALTQLRAVLEERFGGRIKVDVLYVNLDFVSYMGGIENYRRMTSGHGRLSGAADWFFRRAAFPEIPDNADEYLGRFYFDEDEETRLTREVLVAKRPGVADYLDRLIESYGLAEVAIVGFTSLFFQTVASFALARRIKERSPGVVTVLGGAACEAEMGLEYVRRVGQIDYVFSGPALVSFPEFVERRLAGDVAGCEKIDGVFSRSNIVLVRVGGCGAGGGGLRATGADLDINRVVPLDYGAFLDRLEREFPGGEVRAMLLFETSRGCSWGEKVACTFCGLNGTAMRYREMLPGKALGYIREVLDHVPRCRFYLAVDTIVPGGYFGEVFPRLEAPEGVAMMYEVRSDLGEEELEALWGAGVYVIQPGIEALSTGTLKLMRKGTTAFGNIRFLKRCLRHPFRIEWNLLIGSPGEGEEVYEKYLSDLPLLWHLHPPGGAFPISFDRFSQYFERPGEWGLELRPHEYYGYAYPWEESVLAKVAYHFVEAGGDGGRLGVWLDRLNKAVARWWERWDGGGGAMRARLKLERVGGGYRICDSRGGEEVGYAVGDKTVQMLEYLELPRRMREVGAHFGEEAAEREVAYLRERGLIFEERGRMMGLATLEN